LRGAGYETTTIRAHTRDHAVWVPAFAGTTSYFTACNAVMMPLRLTSSVPPGTVRQLPAGTPHALRRLTLDSLHHHRCAGPGRPQCDAAVVDGAARDLGRDQYPLPVRLSVLDHLLCGCHRCDRRPHPVADGRVLAMAAARRAEPDRRHRHDVACYE